MPSKTLGPLEETGEPPALPSFDLLPLTPPPFFSRQSYLVLSPTTLDPYRGGWVLYAFPDGFMLATKL